MSLGIKCPTLGIQCYKAGCYKMKDCLGQYTVQTGKTATVMPYSYSAPSEQCHYGLYPIGKAGKATIWVGREAAISNSIRNGGAIKEDGRPVRLIINCAGDAPWALPADRAGTVMGNEGAKKVLPSVLFSEHAPTPQIIVDWPDYGVPVLDRRWWARLNVALSKLAGDVIVHCVGGHGRTGTAASILAVINGWSGGQCPVTWLRANYCRNVVECQEQIDYIVKMTGVKVTARPRGFQTVVTSGQWKPIKKPGTMSIRKYKKWVRDQKKLYPNAKFHPETIEDLMSGGTKRVVFVTGEWWSFDPATRTFTWLDNQPNQKGM